MSINFAPKLLLLIALCAPAALIEPALHSGWSPITTVPAKTSADSANAQHREFCRATGGYRFEFPRDFFSHSCYKTEWWYFTGNVRTADGRPFGFELTFFREGIDNPYPNPSRWRIADLYLAHFAVSDLKQQKFYYSEKLNRAGIELAGADEGRQRIWNGDWSAERSGETWRLKAADAGHQIELQLRSMKPPVLQGNQGLSQKAAGAGNASYYVSLTRLETTGKIVIAGTAYDISGLSWMDHEFSTNSMAPNQVGWDWLSLQMDDGTEWMLYQLRRADGTRDPFSSGSYVDREGRVTILAAADFEMQPANRWHSQKSGADYPVRWRVRVPKLGFEAQVSTPMPNQELVAKGGRALTYWEGSIAVQGSRNGQSAAGRGYLEMTGYTAPVAR
jgi:predicted secreted hydrolase